MSTPPAPIESGLAVGSAEPATAPAPVPVTRRLLPGFTRSLGLYLLHSAIFHIGLFGISDVVLNFYFVSLGYTSETIGVLQAIARVGGMITGVPVGLLADRIGARRLTIYSTILGAASYVPLLAWPTLPVLLASRMVLGISFSAAFVAASPLLLTLVARAYRTHAFAYFQIITLGATSLGSVIGGFLPGLASDVLALEGAGIGTGQPSAAYAATLTIGGVLLLISIVPLFWLSDPLLATTRAPRTERRRIPWLRLTYLSLPILLFGISAGLTFPFYNLFFRERFGVPDEAVGAILGVGWLCMGLVGLTTPWWEKRFGRATALGIVMAIAAVAFAVLGAAATLLVGVIAFVVAASVRNTFVPLYNPLVMESFSPELYNITSGFGSVLWSLGWFAASTVSGFWQASYGFGFLMSVVAGLVLLTGISAAVIFRRPRSKAGQPPLAPV